MAAPATTGQLRTKVSDMEIGDYIACDFDWRTAMPSTFAKLGSPSFTTEVPITGFTDAGTGGLFYFIKVGKGLLISDRVVKNTITWDSLNGAKFIQGLPWGAGNIIPTMTSNTSPSGTVIRSNETGGTEGWKAFDNDANTYWSSYPQTVPASPAWVGYDFSSPTVIRMYGLTCSLYANNAPKDWTFEGSNDGQTWTVLDTRKGVTTIYASITRFIISNTQAFSKYRINITSITGSNVHVNINQLEMMDTAGIIRSLTGGVSYADVNATNIIPTMTSNTAPSGEASASTIYNSGYDAWKAFDGAIGGYGWETANNTTSGWLAYDFKSIKTIVSYGIFACSAVNLLPKNWTFEGWDGTNWIVLDTRTNQTGWPAGGKRVFILDKPASYSKFRINITTNNGGPYIDIGELALYNNVNFISSSTDLSMGAWPVNNEWDKYIVNFPVDKIQAGKTVDDVFHWSSVYTWTQDTNTGGNTYRSVRGNLKNNTLDKGNSSSSVSTIGFRPVFEYKE